VAADDASKESGEMKRAAQAFQIEMKVEGTRERQVYLVGVATEEAAMEAVARHCGVPIATGRIRVVRPLIRAAIEEYEIGEGTVFRWI
jgi:hypothetical protein